jgi:short-subunit dehydrogenase
LANYAATKAYVQSLAEALAVELKPAGVDVLAAAPRPVASGFKARANIKMSWSLTPAQVGVPNLKALGWKTTVLPGFLTKYGSRKYISEFSVDDTRWCGIVGMGIPPAMFHINHCYSYNIPVGSE